MQNYNILLSLLKVLNCIKYLLEAHIYIVIH